jgi:membrane protein YqaA with SNARE-associated domain
MGSDENDAANCRATICCAAVCHYDYKTKDYVTILRRRVSLSENPDESQLSVSRPDRKQAVLRWVMIVFSIGIAVVIFVTRDILEKYAAYGYPGVFIISLLGNATLIFPAPSFTVVAVGAVLNPYIVGVLAGCGAALGEMTGYTLGLGMSPTLDADTSVAGLGENQMKWLRWLQPKFQRWGVLLIFVLAAIPNPIFDIGGILAGIARMAWWKFLLAAVLGKTGRFILLSVIVGVVVA